MSDSKCFKRHSELPSPPLIQDGRIVIQAHHIGWIVSGFFAVTSTAMSLWLIYKHLTWYTNKHEQRYIVRILLMVPIYSVVSFASYLFWNNSTPLLLIRDCYESTVLTSFFYLLLLYVSPSQDEQKSIFLKAGLSKENDREAIRKGMPIKKWMFPLGSIHPKPKDGLYFLQIMKWGVLQYCFIRPTTTLAAVILDYQGLYCESSWSPGWGHVYITIIVSISVSVAMYCLIQLYVPIASRASQHRPLLKLLAIKAVVFLTFWQATFLSVLSLVGVVKDTKYMTADDINIGIGAIAETVEMTIFALLHIKAFSYKPYCNLSADSDYYSSNSLSNDICGQSNGDNMSRICALGHAFDFRETFRELWHGCVYIVHRTRGIETDKVARRITIRKELFSDFMSQGGIKSEQICDMTYRRSDSPGGPRTPCPQGYKSVYNGELKYDTHPRPEIMHRLSCELHRDLDTLEEKHRLLQDSTGKALGKEDSIRINGSRGRRLNPSHLLSKESQNDRPHQSIAGMDDPIFSRILVNQAYSEASGPTLTTHPTSDGDCYHGRLMNAAFVTISRSTYAHSRRPAQHTPEYLERSREGSLDDTRSQYQQRSSRHQREQAFYELGDERSGDLCEARHSSLRISQYKKLPPHPISDQGSIPQTHSVTSLQERY